MKSVSTNVFKLTGYIFIVLLVVIMFFPYFIALITSFKSLPEIYTSPPTWIPEEFHFKNYAEMFRALPIGKSLFNSLIIATGSSLLALFCAIPAGYVLSRFTFPGRRIFMYTVLMIVMFSPVVIIISLFGLMNKYRLLDTFIALIIPNAALTLSFCIWMSIAFFSSIPESLEEAAMIDGCSRFVALVRIILPISLPGIASIIVFSFVRAWNEFLMANTLLSSHEKFPATVAFYFFVGYRGTLWHYMCGSILVAAVPTAVLFLFIQKWLVSGLTMGAIK